MDYLSMGINYDYNIVVAIDFDGTITKRDNYPDLTYEYNPIAIKWIKKIQQLKVITILWTCGNEKKILQALQELTTQYNIKFNYVNDYKDIRGISRKINADVYIDDRANDGKIRWKKIYKRIKRLQKKSI